MSIEKIVRKKGTVYRTTVRVKRCKVSRSFERKVDAEQWMCTMRVSREAKVDFVSSSSSKDISTDSTTLDQLRFRFEMDYAPLRQSPSTRKLETAVYERYVKPYLGGKLITQVSEQELETHFLWLSRSLHLSNGRINRIRTLLSGVFNRAVKWRYLRFNPVQGTDAFPTDTKPLDSGFGYLSQEECKILLDWLQINDPWLYPKVRVLANCGLRHGEMVALRVRDLLPTSVGATLRISRSYCRHTFEVRNRTKGNRSRLFPLSKPTAHFLSQCASGKNQDDPLLWENWLECRHPTKFNKHFKKAIKLTGINPVRVHDLRHGFAVHFLENGGHLYDLQNLLGHSVKRLFL